MRQLIKSVGAGALSGALTYAESSYALGFTNAIAMPRGFPSAAWEAVFVFGLGAVLVALIIHSIAIAIFLQG